MNRFFKFLSRVSHRPHRFLTPADTYLDYLEPQGVLVGLGFLVHLSHRNDQAHLGYLEIQKFLLCLLDLSDLGVQEHQLPLK